MGSHTHTSWNGCNFLKWREENIIYIKYKYVWRKTSNKSEFFSSFLLSLLPPQMDLTKKTVDVWLIVCMFVFVIYYIAIIYCFLPEIFAYHYAADDRYKFICFRQTSLFFSWHNVNKWKKRSDVYGISNLITSYQIQSVCVCLCWN